MENWLALQSYTSLQSLQGTYQSLKVATGGRILHASWKGFNGDYLEYSYQREKKAILHLNLQVAAFFPSADCSHNCYANQIFVCRAGFANLKALFLLEPNFPNQMLSTAQLHQISPVIHRFAKAYPGLVEAAPKCPQNPWSPPPIASPAEFHRGFVHCVRARICAREWILQCEGARVRSVGVRKHLLYLPRINENRWI